MPCTLGNVVFNQLVQHTLLFKKHKNHLSGRSCSLKWREYIQCLFQICTMYIPPNYWNTPLKDARFLLEKCNLPFTFTIYIFFKNCTFSIYININIPHNMQYTLSIPDSGEQVQYSLHKFSNPWIRSALWKQVFDQWTSISFQTARNSLQETVRQHSSKICITFWKML